MDDHRFDGMARLLGAATARRGALGLLAMLGMGWAAGGVETVAVSKSKRKRRRQRRRRNRNRQRAEAGCPDGQVACEGSCFPECCPRDTRPCYSGPPSTRNVGVCREGFQLCVWDGRWGDLCNGEVTPGAETCNGLDDDCDGVVDSGSASSTCGVYRACANGRCCGLAGASCSGNPAGCCSGSCAGIFCAP